MGSRKPSKSSYQQQSNGEPYWPDLPQPLIKLIAAQPILMCSVHGMGVAKQWRTPNFKCKSTSSSTSIPWLQLIEECIENKVDVRPNPFIASFNLRSELVWHQNVHGDTSMPVGLSRLRHEYYEDNGFLYVWRGNNHWKETKLDYNQVDPNCHNPSEPEHLMRVTNGIGIQGKVYVITLQGTLGVVEKLESKILISRFSKKRMVPSLECKVFREYIIESDGRVLVVFLVSSKSLNVIDDVEVYQLKCNDLTWKRVENLRERSLFVGCNCACSIVASEAGCCPNYVFFTIGIGSGWWEYDMSTRSISRSKYGDSLIDYKPLWGWCCN